MAITSLTPSKDSGAKIRKKNLVYRTLIAHPTQMTTTPAALTFVHSTQTGVDPVTITGITRANPGVVTSAAHGLSTDDYVEINYVRGMIEANNRIFKVLKVGVDSYSLKNLSGTAVNTSSFTAYTSGGEGWKRKFASGSVETGKTIPIDGMQSITFVADNQDGATTATYQVYGHMNEHKPPDFNSSTYTLDRWRTSGSAVPVTAGAISDAITILRQGATQWRWVCLVGVTGAGTADNNTASASVGE